MSIFMFLWRHSWHQCRSKHLCETAWGAVRQPVFFFRCQDFSSAVEATGRFYKVTAWNLLWTEEETCKGCLCTWSIDCRPESFLEHEKEAVLLSQMKWVYSVYSDALWLTFCIGGEPTAKLNHRLGHLFCCIIFLSGVVSD